MVPLAGREGYLPLNASRRQVIFFVFLRLCGHLKASSTRPGKRSRNAFRKGQVTLVTRVRWDSKDVKHHLSGGHLGSLKKKMFSPSTPLLVFDGF